VPTVSRRDVNRVWDLRNLANCGPKADAAIPDSTYSVEKPGFSVLALFRQLVIESVNGQQDSMQPIRANSGEANVVER
jgi:hypothetical protein